MFIRLFLTFSLSMLNFSGNGTIDPDELKIVLRSCMDESKLGKFHIYTIKTCVKYMLCLYKA